MTFFSSEFHDNEPIRVKCKYKKYAEFLSAQAGSARDIAMRKEEPDASGTIALTVLLKTYFHTWAWDSSLKIKMSKTEQRINFFIFTMIIKPI